MGRSFHNANRELHVRRESIPRNRCVPILLVTVGDGAPPVRRRISSITIWVNDLDASARFYVEFLGLPLERSDPEPPIGLPHYECMWGTFDDDSWFLFHIYPAPPGRVTTCAQLGIDTGDLTGLVERAEASGVRVLQPARQEPWGLNAKFLDPDGNVISATAAG